MTVINNEQLVYLIPIAYVTPKIYIHYGEKKVRFCQTVQVLHFENTHEQREYRTPKQSLPTRLLYKDIVEVLQLRKRMASHEYIADDSAESSDEDSSLENFRETVPVFSRPKDRLRHSRVDAGARKVRLLKPMIALVEEV